MTKIIVTLALLVVSMVVAQTKFEQSMQNAMQLWGEGKIIESVALLERTAVEEKEQWLPNYYIALICTTQAFQTNNQGQFRILMDQAQKVLQIELFKQPDHPELLVVQAMIYTAWIVSDPVLNGMTLSGKITELYARAEKIAPHNPRVILGRAEFEMGSAKFLGTDVRSICTEIEKSIELFATFKPETPFHPSWGFDRAQEVLKGCL